MKSPFKTLGLYTQLNRFVAAYPMLLSRIPQIGPEASLLYLERNVNVGSPSGFSHANTTSSRTSPQMGDKRFSVYGVRFSEDVRITTFGDDVEMSESWDLLVHPDMLTSARVAPFISDHEPLWEVAPTASARTVKVIGDDLPYFKLAHEGLIGRIERHLTTDHALSALETSSEITCALDQGLLPDSMFFMPETGARVAYLPSEAGEYELGVVLREANPYPRNPRVAFMIPCFSLFSPDSNAPEDKTILQQLADVQGVTQLEFFESTLAPMLLDAYFRCLLACGLQLELHAQNTLVALSESFEVLGVVVRDAESIDKDLSLIGNLGLGTQYQSKNYKCLREVDDNYAIAHSYMYDFKLGEYLLRPLLEEACQGERDRFDRAAANVREMAKPYIASLPSGFFPGDWYSYPDVLVDRSLPRPYTANGIPLFRPAAQGAKR